ncbi:Allantoinase [anaerobic digester metagenome]
MFKRYLITGATLINEGRSYTANVLIDEGIIMRIEEGELPFDLSGEVNAIHIDGRGKWLLPGIIDDQVHFREPGLTHKGDIYTESRAAVAGGITSYMEMPNTVPNATTVELLEKKYELAAQKSLANYSFYMGASNDNLEELLKINPRKVCGIKVFMGASTGNMLVDNIQTLEAIFEQATVLVAVHCEDETTIRANAAAARAQFGEQVPIRMHPEIRSREACLKSSTLAVNLAKKHHTRLHLLHVSTADELDLLTAETPLSEKRITAEACVHHLWFTDEDYDRLGSHIKWNPAIKSNKDREALIQALNSGKLDIIATDHAPHTLEEKALPYFSCPSGGPLVQHSLPMMLEMARKGLLPVEMVVEKMCHAPARIFNIERRGFIRENYHADLVMVDPNNSWEVTPENIYYKCGWSPLQGTTFHSKITHTFVGGHLAWNNGKFDETKTGTRLIFNRNHF